MRKFKKTALSCIVFFLLVTLGACSNSSDIDLVKNGVLDFDKSLTIGEAFENYKYFTDVSWKAFKTENGRRMVQVSGTIDLNKTPLGKSLKEKGIKKGDIIFQFLIFKDGKHFQVYDFGFKTVSNDGKEKIVDASNMLLPQVWMLYNLREIYNNQPLQPFR
ncbi:MAG: hypothetical protein GWP10_12220 [Nitrospiraceae bacterium]|nr:hypothetical protein [Nitrospiraceae bacterium]